MSLNRRRNSSSRLSRTGIVVSLAVPVLVGLQAAQTSPLVVAAPQVSQDSALRVAALLPYESVNPTTLGTPWAQREETPEQSESRSEAESAQAEASPALRDQAEQLEREASRRSQEIERHMRQQQRAFAHQQREFERQVHQAERARAMALRGGYLAEGPPISEDELIELMLEIAQNDPDSEVREAAFGAIGLIGSEKAMEALIALYDSLQDPRLQRAVLASIGVRAAPTDSAITKLREIAITSGNPELQQTAIGTLVNTGGDRGVDALLYIYAPLMSTMTWNSRSLLSARWGSAGTAGPSRS